MKRRKTRKKSESDEEIWSYCSGKRSKSDNSQTDDGVANGALASPIIAHPPVSHSQSQTQSWSSKTKLNGDDSTKQPVEKTTNRPGKKTGLVRKTNKTEKPQTSLSQSSCKTPKRTHGHEVKAGCSSSQKKTKEKRDGNCPFCQMPFCALTIESPRWHVMECMDLPIKAKQECPAGFDCDCTIASHYRRYMHTVLANLRAGTQVGPPEELQVETVSRKLNFVTEPTKIKQDESRAKEVREISVKVENDEAVSLTKDSFPQVECVSPYFKDSKVDKTVKQEKIDKKPLTLANPRQQLQKFQDDVASCSSGVSSSPSFVSGVSMFKESPKEFTMPRGLPFGAILVDAPSDARFNTGDASVSYPTRSTLNNRMQALKAELDGELDGDLFESDEDIFQSAKEDSESDTDVILAVSHKPSTSTSMS